MHKTPKEIKQAFECCLGKGGCARCPYSGGNCVNNLSSDTIEYIQQLEANQIKGRCKDCKHVIINTHHGIFKGEDMECGLIDAYECDASTTADGYCDRFEQKEDAHGSETGEKHEAQDMADQGP